jgi:signal transduction histidine kinase
MPFDETPDVRPLGTGTTSSRRAERTSPEHQDSLPLREGRWGSRKRGTTMYSGKIIVDILVYGRIKPPEYAPVKVADLVRESLADVRVKRGDEKIRVGDRLDLAGCVIQADSRQLKEVFTNLIDNACDAVKLLQDREGEVRLEGEDLDPDVRIIISDSGVGMDEATLQKLNKPFFTTKSQGTGLGLTVARQIIDLHKGALDIRSEKGRGTSVTVLLPKNKS